MTYVLNPVDDPVWDVLIPADVVQVAIDRIAVKIKRIIESSSEPVVLAMVANGGLWFGMQLVNRLPPQGYHWAVITAQSYGDQENAQNVVLKYDGLGNINGCRVVVVDDIFDTGRTSLFLQKHILELGATAVQFVVLLEKPDRKDAAIALAPDIVGLIIPNLFVAGCGLDGGTHFGYTRNFPEVRYRKGEALPDWRYKPAV